MSINENRPLPLYCDPDNEFKGSQYSETKNLDIKDIAKLVRKDIKKSQKEGKLPKNLKTSVKIDRFSGGQSLGVKIKGGLDKVFNPEYIDWRKENPLSSDYDAPKIYSDETSDTIKKLGGIVNSYNRTNIDTQSDYFDVSFYSNVDLDYSYESDAKKEESE